MHLSSVHALLPLFERAVVFSSVFSMFALSIYFLGSYQQFLDTTLFLLIRVMVASLYLQIYCGLNALVLHLIRLIVGGRFLYIRFTAALCCSVLGFVVLVGVKFLRMWF